MRSFDPTTKNSLKIQAQLRQNRVSRHVFRIIDDMRANWDSPEQAKNELQYGSLSHAEKALAIAYLRKHRQKTKSKEIAALMKVQPYTVRHYFRLAMQLSPEALKALHQNEISFTMARALASIDTDQQIAQLRKLKQIPISVARARARFAGENASITDIVNNSVATKNSREQDTYSKQLSEQISEQVQHPVDVALNADLVSGSLTFRFTGLDMLDALCDRLGIRLSTEEDDF